MKNFYIDINSIIDARQGVIERLAPGAFVEINQEGYHKRKGDFFKGIDPVAYRNMYQANELETLMHGTMTNVMHFLGPQIADVLKEFIASEADTRTRPMLDINVFPYKYSDEDKAYLGGVIHAMLNHIVGVNVIDEDIKNLTPSRCNASYFMMVTYDYDRYLNAHASELIKQPVPGLILVAPMVYFNTNPDEDEETIDYLQQGINSLALLETSIAPRICLKFVDIEVFSVIYPDDRVMKKHEANLENQMSLDDLERVLQSHRDKKKTIPEA